MSDARPPLPELPAAFVASLLDRTGALVYTLDMTQRVVAMGRAMRERLDVDGPMPPDLRALARVLYPEPALRDQVMDAHMRVLYGGRPREAEWVLTTPGGDSRQVRWQLVPHGEGDARVVVALGDDVTERRKLEQWVRLQNALLERIPEAVLIADLDGRILHWSGGAERIFGYPPRSALERPLSNLISAENPRSVMMGWVDTLREQGLASWVHDLRRDDGRTLACRIDAGRVQNERGVMIAIALVIAPAHDLPTADEAATEGLIGALPRALAQVSTTPVVLTGPDGTVRGWSPAAERLAGIGTARALGKKLGDEVMVLPGLGWVGLSTRLGGRGRHSARVTVERPNGTRVAADLDAVAVRNAAGETDAVLVFFADRTELQSLADEARATKERALLSVVTEGVVRRLVDTCAAMEPDHRALVGRLADLRALARLVDAGASSRDLDTFVRQARIVELDKTIDDAAFALGEGMHRLRALVDDVTRFSASEADPPGPVRFSRELEAARDLVAHAFENRVAIEVNVGDLPPARAARGPLLRGLALLLLASAATAASASEARVTIEGKHQAGWIHLEIQDNGAGYAPDVLARISDLAYLATQPGHAPVFLGLAREALRAAGATLEVSAAAGSGTRTRVSFPAADAGQALRVAEPLAPRPRGRGRVLVIEDDALLRRALGRHLGAVHRTDTAASVAEAVGLRGEGWDVAIVAFPRPESFGSKVVESLEHTLGLAPGNVLLTVPASLRPSTRQSLLSQGFIIVPRPPDLTLLQSLVDRLIPPETFAMEGE